MYRGNGGGGRGCDRGKGGGGHGCDPHDGCAPRIPCVEARLAQPPWRTAGRPARPRLPRAGGRAGGAAPADRRAGWGAAGAGTRDGGRRRTAPRHRCHRRDGALCVGRLAWSSAAPAWTTSLAKWGVGGSGRGGRVAATHHGGRQLRQLPPPAADARGRWCGWRPPAPAGEVMAGRGRPPSRGGGGGCPCLASKMRAGRSGSGRRLEWRLSPQRPLTAGSPSAAATRRDCRRVSKHAPTERRARRGWRAERRWVARV